MDPLHPGVQDIRVLARCLEGQPIFRERCRDRTTAHRHAAAVLGGMQQLLPVLFGGRARKLLVENDEGRRLVHFGRLEDALHQHLARAAELGLVLEAEILEGEEQRRLFILLLPNLVEIRLDCVQLLIRVNVARLRGVEERVLIQKLPRVGPLGRVN
eukprot:scaffold138421_cov66-Phaeocystis_antarctica.AAC.1